MSKVFRILLFLLFAMNVNGQSESDSLLHEFATQESDSLRVDAAIRLYSPMIGLSPDSVYLILEEALSLARKNHLDEQLVNLEILKGQVFGRLNNFVEEHKSYLRAEKLLDSLKHTMPDSTYLKHKISITNDIAIVFYRTGKLEEAREIYGQIIKLIEETPEEWRPQNTQQYYVITYNNLGSTYLQEEDYDHAEIYYLKAMSYLDKDDKVRLASILNNLGIIEKDRGNYEQSLDYLNRSIQLRRDLKFLEGEVQTLNNLGDLLWKMGKTRQALDTLQKVSQMADQNQLLQSYTIALDKLSGIYFELKDYRQAYLYHKQYKQSYDSLVNMENLRNITQLEMQQRFEQRIQEESLVRQKEDLIRQRREAIYLFTMITAILLVALLLLLYALQRSKLKRHRLISEKEGLKSKSLELENEKLNLDLEYKNKELTTNVIYLAKTNEFISEVAEKLMKRRVYFTKENQKVIDELIRDLQNFSDRKTWKEFELRFQEVHSDFYNKLIAQFPDLSNNEKKLCAFLRLNMTTKEISAITYQSINSITVARSRLRKKLGIDKDENLIAFLEKL